MPISITTEDGKTVYNITLTRMDFDHLCAGCPEEDRLVFFHRNGARFNIYSEGGSISDRCTYNGEYHLNVGVPVKIIPSSATSQEIDRLTNQFCKDLEKAINGSSKIPISTTTGVGEIVTAYVKIQVKEA